jgi:hypothetical protein
VISLTERKIALWYLGVMSGSRVCFESDAATSTHERSFQMSKTTSIRTNDAEMRALSDAELDAVVGGAMSINIPGDKTKPSAPGASGQVTGGTDINGWAFGFGIFADTVALGVILGVATA